MEDSIQNLFSGLWIIILIGSVIIIVLNKFLWAWYLDLKEFKEYQHKLLIEAKKQIELLKLLCDQKGIDTNSLTNIEGPRPKGNLFVKPNP
jgi:K+ transporter